MFRVAHKLLAFAALLATLMSMALPRASADATGQMMAKMLKKFDKSGDSKVYVIGAEKPLIQWDESDASVPSVNAGLVTTLTQQFFNEFNSLVLDIFQGQINHMDFEDFCTEQGFGKIMNINLCVVNQQMNDFKLDKQRSEMLIKSYNKSL